MKFEEEPNYAYLKELLKDVFTRNKYDYDFDFDWNNRTVLERKSTLGLLMDKALLKPAQNPGIRKETMGPEEDKLD